MPFSLLTAKPNGLLGRNVTSRPPIPNKFTSKKYGYHGNTNTLNNNNNNTDVKSLEVITNEIFGNLMLDKSDQLVHNFDELGILDPESSAKVRSEQVTKSVYI